MKRWMRMCVTAVGIGSSMYAYAESTLGDIANQVIPGAGAILDNGANDAITAAFVQSATPVLQELIMSSRDDAWRTGVHPIPSEMRRQLAGFIPDEILNAARYRVQSDGDMTLQAGAIQYGDARAITLDDVIVFKNQGDVLYSPTLWVHELTHVGQYRQWGVRGFARRYLQNYQAVEREAYAAADRYVDWLRLKNRRNAAAWHLEGTAPR